MTFRYLFATAFLCLNLTPALAQDMVESDYEQILLQTIEDIHHLNHDQALADTREFIRQYPTSKLGQLLYADLLLAKADILPTIGYGIQSKSQLDDLTFEIKQRLSNQQALAYAGYLPENLIALSQSQPYVLVMDQSLSRVYVYRNEQGMPVLEIRRGVERAYNKKIQKRLSRTVWASGCKSWYLDENGKNTTLWPGFTVEYWFRTRRFRLD